MSTISKDDPDSIDGDASEESHKHRRFFLAGLVAMLIFGWVVFPFLFYRSVNQPIQFSHEVHTGDNVELTCADCHTFGDNGRFNGIPSIEKCRECHSQPMGVSDEEAKLVRDYIKPDKEIPWSIYSLQPQNVFFSHATHVKLVGLACRTCHFGQGYTDKLRPARYSRLSGYSIDVFGRDLLNAPSTPSTGMRMDNCSGCHKQYGIQESCIDCHK